MPFQVSGIYLNHAVPSLGNDHLLCFRKTSRAPVRSAASPDALRQEASRGAWLQTEIAGKSEILWGKHG